MRKITLAIFIISSLVSLISPNVWAADDNNLAFRTSGVYVTLGAGVAKTNYASAIQNYMSLEDHAPDIIFGGLTEPHDHNFGAVGSIGYIWDRYFGTELSYYYFSGANFSSSWATSGFSTYEDYRALQQAVALTAIGRLPIGDTRSDVYAKLGLAYTRATLGINYSSPDTTPAWSPTTLNYHRDFSAGSIAPLVGLGWELNFSRHWAMDAEGIVIVPQRKDMGDYYHTKLGSAALFSIGGSYKF